VEQRIELLSCASHEGAELQLTHRQWAVSEALIVLKQQLEEYDSGLEGLPACAITVILHAMRESWPREESQPCTLSRNSRSIQRRTNTKQQQLVPWPYARLAAAPSLCVSAYGHASLYVKGIYVCMYVCMYVSPVYVCMHACLHT
jgi:hypothetical protein